jgi:hypothetical protein
MTTFTSTSFSIFYDGHSDRREEWPLLTVETEAIGTYTVKNVCDIPIPTPQPGCHLPNIPWAGIIYLFPPMESLVSDIPAGDGNIENLFYDV